MLLAIMAPVSACSELSEPTVVRYEFASPFYVRHNPLLVSERRVETLAMGFCADAGGEEAQLVSSEQWYFFDTRTATYRCSGLAPAFAAEPLTEPGNNIEGKETLDAGHAPSPAPRSR